MIPASQSLKEKRLVLKRIKDKVRRSFNVSIAETGYMEKWQRSELGLAAVSNESGNAEGRLNKVIKMIESQNEIEIIRQIVRVL